MARNLLEKVPEEEKQMRSRLQMKSPLKISDALQAKRFDMEKLILDVAQSSVWLVAVITLILAAYLVGVDLQKDIFG